MAFHTLQWELASGSKLPTLLQLEKVPQKGHLPILKMHLRDLKYHPMEAFYICSLIREANTYMIKLRH
jgi:hypothetical protein